MAERAAVYTDLSESGESYEVEMYHHRIEVGSRIAVIKERNPYLGRVGRVLSVGGHFDSSDVVYQVGFGDSDIHSFSEGELIRMTLDGEMTTIAPVLAGSMPEKDPLGCQEWNSACVYDGYRFCPKGCGLWLCTHHYHKHENSCPANQESLMNFPERINGVL